MKFAGKRKPFPVISWFLHNWNYKLLSFLVALLLWLGAVRDRETTETIELPIRIIGLADNLIVSQIDLIEENKQKTVEISRKEDFQTLSVPFIVVGKAREILKNNKDKKNWYYELDLARFSKGEYILNISKRNIMNFNTGIDISLPAMSMSIKVTIDEKEEKFVNIEPAVTGKVAEGYKQIGAVVIKPNNVIRIKGPKSVTKIVTSPIDLSNAKKTFTKEISLLLPPNTDIVSKDASKLTATITIVELKTVELIDIPVTVNGDYSLLAPKIISIVIRIPVEYSEEKVKREIKASIDLKNVPSRENTTIKPTLTIPPYAELVSFKPLEGIQVIKK